MANRCPGRNVHIYSAKDTSTVLGGGVASYGVTNSNFYSMVEIIFILDNDYTLSTESGTVVPRDDKPLQPGKYFIDTTKSLIINNEPWLVRTGDVPPESSNPEFDDAVCARDGGCVITGVRDVYAMSYGDWIGYQVTYIVPLEFEKHWVDDDHGSDGQITNRTTSGKKSFSLNSIQNGVLLRSDIHKRFERYLVSINPDDNYKIVCFKHDNFGIAGRYLGKTLLEHPQRPGDEFLRWHFRQAVLANMRGEGVPIFE